MTQYRQPRTIRRQFDLIGKPSSATCPEHKLAGNRGLPRSILSSPAPPTATAVVISICTGSTSSSTTVRHGTTGRTPTGPATAERTTSRRRRCDAAQSAARVRRRRARRMRRAESRSTRSKPRADAAVRAAGNAASSTWMILTVSAGRLHRRHDDCRGTQAGRGRGPQDSCRPAQFAERGLAVRRFEPAAQLDCQGNEVCAADALEPIQEP